MSKYNIDNGKTAIVDEIKHHEKHNQAKNLNRQLMTNDFLCRLYACRQLKCMFPGPKHVAKCLVWRKQWMKAVLS